MKIAIVGANGYLGRNLLHDAVAKGHQVTAYDQSNHQVDGYVNYHQIDLLDPISLSNLDFNVDAIYLMAGRTGTAEGFDNYQEFIDGNEKSLLNLLTAYRQQNATAKIVFPSTRLVYQGSTESLAEDAPKQFKTIYAINKFACEQYLEQFGGLFGVNFCVLRLGIPFGTVVPGASSYGTLEFMLSKAKSGSDITLYGDGFLRRTFTYVSDVTDQFLRAGMPGVCHNQIYNVGGLAYSLKEVAELIAPLYGVGVKHIAWPPLALALESGDTVFDDTRLTKEIGNTDFTTIPEWLGG